MKLQIILAKIQIDDKAADPIHQRGTIYDFAAPNKIDSNRQNSGILFAIKSSIIYLLLLKTSPK
jgi:hypothetical protein